MAKFKNIPKKPKGYVTADQRAKMTEEELQKRREQAGIYRNRQMNAANKNPEGGKDGSTE